MQKVLYKQTKIMILISNIKKKPRSALMYHFSSQSGIEYDFILQCLQVEELDNRLPAF